MTLLRPGIVCVLLAIAFSAWGTNVSPDGAFDAKGLKACDYYNIVFRGNTSWSIDNVARTFSFAIDRIDNLCTESSQAIQVRALISTTPVEILPFTTLFAIGQFSLDALPANGSHGNLTRTVPLVTPPDGTYHLYIGAYENECGPNCYRIDDYVEVQDVIRVSGGQITLDNPTHHTLTAVEYFHASFGHYFLTAQADEIAGLDAGVFAGWERTGQSFKIYNYGPDVHDLCRFFTTFFAPKSSHFYTAVGSECAGVKENPVWVYEKIAGKVGLPGAGGQCPTGQVPLYRLYNDGKTGAPNHRYTTSLAIRGEMLAQGFTPEDPNTVCIPQ